MPSATSCVKSTLMLSKPAASSPASYSPFGEAPAMQPTKPPRSARSSGESRSSATTSLIPIRPPGLQHPGDLRQHRGLVGREVDDAVRDHDVDRGRRQRHVLDHALEEDRVAHARLRRVRPCQRQHLVGHVEPEREAGLADAPCREDHVDAAAGAEVEHGLPLVQVGDRGRVAAAERGERGRLGQLTALLRVVERLAEEVALAAAAGAAPAAAARALAQPRARTRRSGAAPPRAADPPSCSSATHPFRSATAASVSTASRFNEK